MYLHGLYYYHTFAAKNRLCSNRIQIIFCMYVEISVDNIILEWTKLVCTPASTALFAWHCVQVRYRHIRQAAIPARVVLGTAVFCDQSNQYLVYEFPFCAMHMRVSSVSLPYLQNRLPSLIISAILAQYSSLCDHLVLQFNFG